MSDPAARVELCSIRIPSLPEVLTRLEALVADPDVGVAEVGAVVAVDPPVAAKVLRTANSAAYGLREPVRTVQRAAAVLGIRTLRNLVLQVCLVETFEHLLSEELLDLEALWRHSIVTALTAQDMALKAPVRKVDPYDAYTCGLLHELGEVVLFESHRERYAPVLRATRGDVAYERQLELEREALGLTHADVGALVAREWGLPDVVVHCIRLHHGSSRELSLAPMAATMALADGVVRKLQRGPGELDIDALAAEPGARILGLDAVALENVVRGADEALGNVPV